MYSSPSPVKISSPESFLTDSNVWDNAFPSGTASCWLGTCVSQASQPNDWATFWITTLWTVAQHETSVIPYKLKISVLFSFDFHCLSTCTDGHGSPPSTKTRNEDFSQRTMLRISSTDQRIINEGVASRTVTGCSVSVNNTFNSRCGDNFTAWVTKRSTAPLERARNSSTMLGSNVKGEARKITSLDCTDRMDLKNKITKHTSFYNTLFVAGAYWRCYWQWKGH